MRNHLKGKPKRFQLKFIDVLMLWVGVALAVGGGTSLANSAGAHLWTYWALMVGTLLCALAPVNGMRRQIDDLSVRILKMESSE
jgi:hypothetical protein